MVFPLGGTPDWVWDAQAGQGLYFNATDSEFAAALLATLPLANDEKTISYWFISPGVGGGYYYSALASRVNYGGVDNDDKGYLHGTGDGRVVYNHTGAGDTISGPAIVTNRLYQVIITTGIDGADVAHYLNGVRQTLTTNTIGKAAAENPAGFLVAARQSTAYANGAMFDLRLYSRRIRDAEALVWYQNPWELYRPRVQQWLGYVAAGGANYDVLLTLARIATATPAASAAALAGAALARIAAVIDGGLAASSASATLARQAAIIDAAAAAALAAALLGRQGDLADVATAAALASTTLARQAELVDAAVAIALASATLARQAALTDGAIAAAVTAMSLVRQGGLTDAAIAAALGSSMLTRQASIAQGAGAAASAVTTLARQSAIAEGGAATADASLSVAIVKA
ncbi:MAG TPA: LamG-like jellyroll fold domain-containing protein, partial [Acidocella sp.]|nr:LamG-like jellyroll fold domain-containing protein [Acidocella sp.]